MKPLAALALTLALLPVSLQGQQPTVSPSVTQRLQREAEVVVWLFGHPARTVGELAVAVTESGGRVRRHSRWLHAVSATLDRAALDAVRRRPEFRHIQPLARFRGVPEPIATAVAVPRLAAAAADSSYGAAIMPMRRLNVFPLVHKGLRGAGVRIAILDTGFETGLAPFASANVVAAWDFVSNDSIVRQQAGDPVGATRHGTQVWSLLAADVPGTMIGVAPDAEYLLARTEDVSSETRVEEDHWIAAVEWADSIGVHVITSSVGYLNFDAGQSYQASDLNGDIATTTIVADAAAARGIAVVVAMGNRGILGFVSLVTPADGDSVISVGAEDSLGLTAVFSSRGPTADRRLKPDLMAPGVAVFVADPQSGTGYGRADGTSFATPLIAGVAALMKQLHPTLSGVDIRDALRRTGSSASRPDSTRGWGRPSAAAAAYFPMGVRVTTPGDSVLTTVTPTVTYAAPLAPAIALPLSYRVVLATDTALGNRLIDTTVTETSVTVPRALRPNSLLAVRVTATSADTVSLATPTIWRVVPPWVTLTALNDSGGQTIRDVRPTFTWTSPGVSEPPGPFLYDLVVERADNGFVEVNQPDLTVLSFTPTRDLERNTPYRWRVTARTADEAATVRSNGTFVIVDDSAPPTTLLFQNFPNPFPNRTTGQSATCIWFDVAHEGPVTLDILDIRGLRVRNLVPGSNFPPRLMPGRYGRAAVGVSGPCDSRLTWDGTDENGRVVPRGIYLVRLKTDRETLFKRIVFMGNGS